MKTKILSLEKIPLIYLYYSFIIAFSDYEIKVKLTFKSFKNLLKTRDVKLSLSYGVFIDQKIDKETLNYFENQLAILLPEKSIINKDKNRIRLNEKKIKKIPISFILCGFRKNFSIYCEKEDKILKFKKALYDSGTATLPFYRGKGFSKSLLKYIIQNSRKKNIDGFILEVLQNNEKAKNLYLSFGFNISRKFFCYRAEKINLVNTLNENLKNNLEINNLSKKIKIKKLTLANFIKYTKDKEIFLKTISWQNSIESVKNIFKKITSIAIFYEKKLIAIGAIENFNGDIKFLAINNNINEEFKKNNLIESILLLELIKYTNNKNISFLNIDNSMATKIFLEKINFINFINQYEMFLNL